MKTSLRIPASILAATLALGGLGVSAAAAAPVASQCSNPLAPVSVEEQRLTTLQLGQTKPTARILLEAGGFARNIEEFTRQLCATSSWAKAKSLAGQAGNQLWKDAVDRAQGRLQQGNAEQIDDRPLYWARLALTKTLRQWVPKFALDATQRAKLSKSLDYASRGVTSIGFPAGSAQKRRVLLTGFDPFSLAGSGIRRVNPSGIAALQLDGKEIQTVNGPAVVQAAMLPVDWRAFDDGIVEQVYGTGLSAPAEQRPGTIITISQGGGSGFNIEQWAGRYRTGADNNSYSSSGDAPLATGWPQIEDQFIRTSLPAQQMIDAGTGKRAVILNPRFCESANADRSSSSCQNTGKPTPGSYSVSGGGGNYLSNESMYRANRIRLALGRTDVAGGHLHTPVYDVPPVIDGSGNAVFFDTLRRDTQQVLKLVTAAAAAQKK